MNERRVYTLDAESQGRLAHGFPTAVGGAAGVQSGPKVRDGAEYQTDVAENHSGADIVHQGCSLFMIMPSTMMMITFNLLIKYNYYTIRWT